MLISKYSGLVVYMFLTGVNVRLIIGVILCCLEVSVYIGYCKDSIKCDSASNAPNCPLNNNVVKCCQILKPVFSGHLWAIDALSHLKLSIQ